MQDDYNSLWREVKKELPDCIDEGIASLQNYRRGFKKPRAKDFISSMLKKDPLAGEDL
jgi:hypothetical protein